MSILKRMIYVMSAPTGADAANTGIFIIMQDLESLSGKSSAILCGASTLGNDLYFSANFSAMDASMFNFHYDMKLFVKDVTVNVLLFSLE